MNWNVYQVQRETFKTHAELIVCPSGYQVGIIKEKKGLKFGHVSNNEVF